MERSLCRTIDLVLIFGFVTLVVRLSYRVLYANWSKYTRYTVASNRHHSKLLMVYLSALCTLVAAARTLGMMRFH
jgi:hypothetical protein